MKEKNKYFTESDAWVLTSLFWSVESTAKIELSTIIANGDMLNHAILLVEEIKEGFYKAQKKGLITIKEETVTLSNQAIEIREKIKNGRGGLFSIVENMFKKLNSPRLKLSEIEDEDINECSFINKDSFNKAYEQYKKSTYNKAFQWTSLRAATEF